MENKEPKYVESEWRHRQLSDEKIQYFIDRTNNTIHDKRCKNLRNISDESIICLQDYDFACNQCRKCAVDAYIHIGAKDPKDFREYKQYFARVKASIDNVRFLYVENRMKTKLERNSLKIWCGEDMWIIQALDEHGNVLLKHNNYYKNPDGSRRYAAGFHIQNEKCQRCRIKYALDVISQYDYQDHLIRNEEVESDVLNLDTNDVVSSPKNNFVKKILDVFGLDKLFKKLVKWIKQL